MKKVFVLSFIWSFFLFSPEASCSNPYESLKEKQEILKNLPVCEQELKKISHSLGEYYDEIEGAPSNVIKLDPFCGDGIQRILKDVQKIRETDPIGSIVVFFDIDQFTLWKNGFTPTSPLSEIEINNFYEQEDHKSLFRDGEFLNVIKEFKKLNCVFYGLTARYSNLNEYSKNDFYNIKMMCRNLQQLIKFDNFPEEFTYRHFFSYDLAENDDFFEPLFGCSGIFLTGQKLKAIQYLFKEGQELGLFNSKTVPSHIIFGDDSAHNFQGEISENMKCYHWPYPEIQANFLPFVKLHENIKEALTHVQYVFCAQTSLENYAYNLLQVAQDEEKIYADCLKAMLDEVVFDKEGSFLNYMGGYTPFRSLNAVIDYLKWNHEDHKEIQKFLLNKALVSCLFNIGLDVYEEHINNFYNSKEDKEESEYQDTSFSENLSRGTEQLKEKSDSKKIYEYKMLYQYIRELFRDVVLSEKVDFPEINLSEKERMLNDIIKSFIIRYAHDEVEEAATLFEFVKMSFRQDEELN